jgi:hypothetical protein
MLVAEAVGLQLVRGDEGMHSSHMRTRVVEREYTADKEAMMRWIYCAEFWVASDPILESLL